MAHCLTRKVNAKKNCTLDCYSLYTWYRDTVVSLSLIGYPREKDKVNNKDEVLGVEPWDLMQATYHSDTHPVKFCLLIWEIVLTHTYLIQSSHCVLTHIVFISAPLGWSLCSEELCCVALTC